MAIEYRVAWESLDRRARVWVAEQTLCESLDQVRDTVRSLRAVGPALARNISVYRRQVSEWEAAEVAA